MYMWCTVNSVRGALDRAVNSVLIDCSRSSIMAGLISFWKSSGMGCDIVSLLLVEVLV